MAALTRSQTASRTECSPIVLTKPWHPSAPQQIRRLIRRVAHNLIVFRGKEPVCCYINCLDLEKNEQCFGVPDHITTDRGPAFLSELWSALARLLGTTHHTTTAYNPAANGLVERFHKSLKPSLMASCTAEDWKYQLPWVLLGLRTAPSAPSAAEKTYGESLVVPGKLVTEDRHNPSVQRLCDMVSKSYRDPFRVLERNNKAFLLALSGRNDWVLIDWIKPALLEEDSDVTAAHPLPGHPSPQPGPRKQRAHGRPKKWPPSPAVRQPHAQSAPPLSSRSRGTLQRPSRYAD
ncbi:uncharacterized protein [Macrobrachium rosenbergii]|uniref:uncharacterized protein n=1 Tax=Macrobrachium rosenbergii TaxID=79674 RepID=UPI0034D604B0